MKSYLAYPAIAFFGMVLMVLMLAMNIAVSIYYDPEIPCIPYLITGTQLILLILVPGVFAVVAVFLSTLFKWPWKDSGTVKVKGEPIEI